MKICLKKQCDSKAIAGSNYCGTHLPALTTDRRRTVIDKAGAKKAAKKPAKKAAKKAAK